MGEKSPQATVAAQYDSAGQAWHEIRGSGHELLEKPAMYALLPNVEGKRVLCVGCGFGDECERISALGAAHVVGIDLAVASIQRARCAFPTLDFLHMDMEHLSFDPASFDIIFSSLTLHYVPSWKATLLGMRRCLAPEGSIVLSTHHPAAWSARKEEDSDGKRQLLGFELDKGSGEISFFGDYLHERAITAKLGGAFEASFYHKSFSGMLREFRDAGLSVIECTEPAPIPEAQSLDPQFFQIRSRFPLFILFRLEPHCNSRW